MSCSISLRRGPPNCQETSSFGLDQCEDLQVYPLSDLAREFGGATAQRLKNLALGIDDSPVTPTGAPQVGPGWSYIYFRTIKIVVNLWSFVI